MIVHSSGDLKVYIHDVKFNCCIKDFKCKDGFEADIKSFISEPKDMCKQTIFYITDASKLVGYMSCRIMTSDTVIKSCTEDRACSEDCIPYFEVMALARHENDSYRGIGAALLTIAGNYVSYIKDFHRCELNNIILMPKHDIVRKKFYENKMNYISMDIEDDEMFDGYMINSDDVPNERVFFKDRDPFIDGKVAALFEVVNHPCGKG